MSADEKREHDNGPEKDIRPVVTGVILARMQRKGNPDLFAPDEELGMSLEERSEPAADTDPASDDILGTLLKAIQSTEVAAEFERRRVPGFGPFIALDPRVTADVAFDPPVKGEQSPQPVQAAKRRAQPRRSPPAAGDIRPAEILADTSAEVARTTAPQRGKAGRDPELFSTAEVSGPAPGPGETSQTVPSRRAVRGKTRCSPATGKPRTPARRRAGSRTQKAPEAPAIPVVETALEAAPGRAEAVAASAVPTPSQSVAAEARSSTEPLPVFLAPMLPVTVKPAATETAPVVVEVPAAVAEAAPDLSPVRELTPVKDVSTRAPGATGINGDAGLLTQRVGLAAERLTRAGKHFTTLLESLFVPQDSRRNGRLVHPPLIAYPWAAGSEGAQRIVNISSTGLYLRTEERWPPGGTLCMTLQRTDRARGSPGSWIVVEFMVVRWCSDGLAGTFIPSPPGQSYAVIGRAENCADEKSLHRFIKQLPPVAQPTTR